MLNEAIHVYTNKISHKICRFALKLLHCHKIDTLNFSSMLFSFNVKNIWIQKKKEVILIYNLCKMIFLRNEIKILKIWFPRNLQIFTNPFSKFSWTWNEFIKFYKLSWTCMPVNKLIVRYCQDNLKLFQIFLQYKAAFQN